MKKERELVRKLINSLNKEEKSITLNQEEMALVFKDISILNSLVEDAKGCFPYEETPTATRQRASTEHILLVLRQIVIEEYAEEREL